jgi:hypothetical protein
VVVHIERLRFFVERSFGAGVAVNVERHVARVTLAAPAVEALIGLVVRRLRAAAARPRFGSPDSS